MKRQLPHPQTIVNVVGGALLFWLAAPLLTIGDWRPFDGVAARIAGLATIAAAVLLAPLLLQAYRRRRNRRLLDQLRGSDPAAAEALRERFDQAMQLLRQGADAGEGSSWRRWWRGRRQLYQLPWYVFIGAPGAGKTTALLRSGLRFPLAERLGTVPVAGIGGTRQCDWWFADRAVFIDTAGRYTTQDSHAAVDAGEWQEFLRLLRRYRPVQPINGVIVSVSVPDLLAGGGEIERQAESIDARLRELRSVLGMSFPVYVLVTKCDLLAGFDEFFGQCDAAQREQIWGLTFTYPPAAGAGPLPPDLDAQLDGLAARIRRLIPERLQQEPLQQRRAAIYHFDAQVEALLPALTTFLRRALRATADAPQQTVRGIYLTSGTQEGNPIDRVIGELGRSWGLALKPLPRPDGGGGKAYFLTSLLRDLVIAEAPLAGTNLQRQRLRRRLGTAAAGTLAAALLLACGAWWASYRRNADYVDAVRLRVEQAAQRVDPARARDLDQLLPLYALLRNLAAEQGVDPTQAPFGFGFGLYQGPRLMQSADQAYHRLLDQTLGPLLADSLLRSVRRESDAAARYEALRAYLMLVTPGRLQRDEVRRWAATYATAGGASGSVGAGERAEWLDHLDALLERNAVLEAVRVDQAAVRAARAQLRQLPLAQRVHERLLAQARPGTAAALGLVEIAGPEAALVFTAADAKTLPSVDAVYTRQAWTDRLAPALEPAIGTLADEAGWVLGESGPTLERLRNDAAARDEIAAQVGRRHAQATIAQWDALLGALQLQPPADGDALARLATRLAAQDSPLRQLLRRLGTEFGATRSAGAPSAAGAAFDAALRSRYGALLEYAAAAAPVVDPLLQSLSEATAGGASAATTSELARALRAEAARAPAPLRQWWETLADAVGAIAPRPAGDGAGIGVLAQACRELIGDRFPFAPQAKRDISHADFARLFGPQGLLDEFFRAHVAPQVDTRTRPWRLAGKAVDGATAADARLRTVRAFEMADGIRHLFFPAGARLPQLQLRLTPLAMDRELLQFSIDVDGQLLRYENGPRRPKTLQWPGPGATGRVLMRILPAGPSNIVAESHEGPWAVLRVMPRSEWQRGSGGALPRVRLQVDSRTLSLEVATDAQVDPALIADLAEFRCPEAW